MNFDKASVSINLRAKKLEDISFLAEMPQLEVLDLSFNQISDISPLQILKI
ncbi:MAG: leucine-rich repeat domain-containing protein [Nostocaceae cyanobacterium CSU_2_110]|nr:leucine-rich repeat domain-containing protein [Nostocaceae cyanobacterium CSU_2_110]